MTKKIFAMFLAVLMVAALLPTSVFAAGCPGKGSNNHTLENCEWEVVDTTAPTCGKDGWTSYKCKTCGDMFISSRVPATGEHNFVEAIPAKAPTCDTAGHTAYLKCACGAEKGKETIPALYTDRHCEWTDWAPAAVNCLTGGVQTRYCLHCGAEQSREVPKSATGEHTWGEPVLVTPATAEADGKAVVTCTACGEQKEVIVYFKHVHDKLYIPIVHKTCTTDGMKAHWECRVCGGLFNNVNWNNPNTAAQTASLVIPASHNWDNPETAAVEAGPTCANPTAFCYDCQKYITVPVADLHNYKWEVMTPATCTDPGLKVGECQNAGCKTPMAYDIVPALGHISMSKTVEATCGTYAYTFSYCLRPNCSADKLNQTLEGKQIYVDKDGIWFDVSIGEGPVAGIGFNLGVYQGVLGKTLYFTGNTANKEYYFETTEDITEAVEVMLEQVEGKDNSYLMSFMKNGVKTYITMVKSGNYFNAKLTTEVPTSYWNWNSEYHIMTMTLDGTECYLGAYNNYDTLSCSKLSYLQSALASSNPTSFACDYLTIDDSKLHVYDVIVHYAAGFDADNHNLVEKVTIPATCQSAGEKVAYCINHECPVNYIVTEVIPQLGHNWIDATYDQCTAAGFVVPTVNGEPVTRVEPTCTTAGYAYQYCSMCTVLQRNVLPALGHLHDEREELVILTHEGSHTENGYKYWICERTECTTNHIVITETFTWAGRNHTWDTIEEALAAHDGKLIYDGVFLPGTCSVTGLERWICTDENCLSGYVYTKQWVEGKDGLMHITGKHGMPADVDQKAPTCTEPGYIDTYRCPVCDAIFGAAPLGEPNYIPAHGHDYQANPLYKAPAHDTPVFEGDANWQPKEICSICGDLIKDGSKFYNEVTMADIANDHCTKYTYFYYLCHCGKEHAYNFVGALGHVWREDINEDGRIDAADVVEITEIDENGVEVKKTIPAYKAPTCYETGYQYYRCGDCGIFHMEVLAMVEHVNKAGEKFTDKCTDTVTDRHCVTCHEHYNHVILGTAHDCYTADVDGNGVLDCLGECLIGKICHPTINGKFPSTCIENAYTLWYCPDCKTENVEWANLGWNGHKPPMAMTDSYGDPIKFANYDYFWATWTSIDVVDGEFVVNTERYWAEVLDYKAASYTEAGYWVGVCLECQMEVNQPIAKKAGLEFNLIASNPVASEYTLGSLVEVIVQANSAETSIFAFNFAVEYTSGLTYVGYERLNNDFVLTVTEPTVAKNAPLTIVGVSNNTAEGKRQEVAIEPETNLVKLFFRVSEVETELQTKAYDVESISLVRSKDQNFTWKLDNTALAFETYGATIKTRQFLDFNRDGYMDVTDLHQATGLTTGELGFTYDVTIDLDKDGVVNGDEIRMAYNYIVNNLGDVELWTMSMSDLEKSLVLGDDTLHCVQCGKVIAGYEQFCPHCGRNPK